MIKKIKKPFSTFFKNISTASFIFLLVMPYSANYKLKDYGFGNGGASNSSAGGYSLEAITGDVGGAKESYGAYGIGPGLTFTNQANVPSAPTFTNPSNYYNKLQIIINTSGNPTDTKYAIAISTDNFVTTNYVKSDDTVGATLVLADYQTYAAWGGASGVYIIGLTAGTTYTVKVKAMQGRFTETGYGPTASAATVNPTLSFSITTDTQSSPPFSIGFGSMNPGTINSSSPHQINVSLSTNGVNGGRVYVYSANAGLYSTIASHKISSVSNDLSGISEGFGAQGISGGTLTLVSPYDQTGTNTVGIVDQTVRSIFNTTGPIASGTGSFLFKAKPLSTAPAASDYAETLTVVASGSF
jgi:hypothetical protein